MINQKHIKCQNCFYSDYETEILIINDKLDSITFLIYNNYFNYFNIKYFYYSKIIEKTEYSKSKEILFSNIFIEIKDLNSELFKLWTDKINLVLVLD